jgi:stearoyl-CoA desaturase (delta-9 desaturase)
MTTTTAATPPLETAPWKRSWFFCAPGEIPTFLFIIFIHVSAVLGIVFLPMPPWQVLAVAFGLLFLGGMGTTVCYHRALSHRSFKLNVVVEQILIFFAMSNSSGNPQTWVANHRLHHQVSDTAEDLSSPHFGGFWWAHLRWLWQWPAASVEKYCKDLDKPRYRFWGKLQVLLLAISCFSGFVLLAFGYDWKTALAACVWIGPVRLLWALHVQCSVNSVCHLGPIAAEHGSGSNLWWLAPFHLFQGENWHSNHHGKPLDHRLGRKWWQLDLGLATINALAAVGLAKDFKSKG